jgi:hypothetical protein
MRGLSAKYKVGRSVRTYLPTDLWIFLCLRIWIVSTNQSPVQAKFPYAINGISQSNVIGEQ